MERIFNNVKITSSFEIPETRENLVSGETIGQHFGKIAKVIDDLENGEFSRGINEKITEHTDNSDIHVTASDKENWNSHPNDVQASGNPVIMDGLQGGVPFSEISLSGENIIGNDLVLSVSGKNFLKNSDFTDPLNSNGQTEYSSTESSSAAVITIDSWYSWLIPGKKIIVGENCITIIRDNSLTTSKTDIRQRLDAFLPFLRDQEITVSVNYEILGDDARSQMFVRTATEGGSPYNLFLTDLSKSGYTEKTVKIPSNVTYLEFGIWTNDSLDIYNAQIEIGRSATEFEAYRDTVSYSITPDSNPYTIPNDIRQLEGLNNISVSSGELNVVGVKENAAIEKLYDKLDNADDTYALKSKYGDTTINVGRKADSDVGEHSTAEGSKTTASGESAHAEGRETTASGKRSHAEGSNTTAIGSYAHAEGYNTTAIGDNSHSEGCDTEASGGSHAEGYASKAVGGTSHAEGQNTVALGNFAHSEGFGTNNAMSSITSDTALADIITAWNTTKFSLAKGVVSHVEGRDNLALASYSHAEGDENIANAQHAHAEGYHNIADNYASHAGGHFSVSMTTGGSYNNTTGTAFAIGNGTSETTLSNAFSVQYSGVVKAKSTITASTTADYAEFFEWLDSNPNNEDRVGYFVTLDGDKIRIATNADDYILGVVSGEPFVLGNGDCDTWNGMYLHDEFRRTIYEPAPKMEEVFDDDNNPTGEFKEVEGEYEGTRPKLNPDYDYTQKYISRFDRKEWSPVGMLGVLAVRHDGTAKVNGYVTVNKDGIATECSKSTENSYRVIKSNSDSVVEIIFR